MCRTIINDKFFAALEGVVVVVDPEEKMYEAKLHEYLFEVAGDNVQRVWEILV